MRSACAPWHSCLDRYARDSQRADVTSAETPVGSPRVCGPGRSPGDCRLGLRSITAPSWYEPDRVALVCATVPIAHQEQRSRGTNRTSTPFMPWWHTRCTTTSSLPAAGNVSSSGGTPARGRWPSTRCIRVTKALFLIVVHGQHPVHCVWSAASPLGTTFRCATFLAGDHLVAGLSTGDLVSIEAGCQHAILPGHGVCISICVAMPPFTNGLRRRWPSFEGCPTVASCRCAAGSKSCSGTGGSG